MMHTSLLERVALRLCRRMPLSLLRKVTRTNLIITYYHIVNDEEVAHVKHLYKYKSVREFKTDLDFIQRHYVPISLKDLLNHIRGGCSLPDRAFLLTFDDGYREMADVVAPVLVEKGISATFFVNSAFVDNNELCYLNKASLIVEEVQKRQSSRLEDQLCGIMCLSGVQCNDVKSGIASINHSKRYLLDEMAGVMDIDFKEYSSRTRPYLSAEQIRELIKKGFTIGAHSVDHPLYSLLSLEEQVWQTLESVKYVREMFNLDYSVFAFPHSDQNVSMELFARLSTSGLVDLTFGTSGLIDDSAPKNLQRFSLENPLATAEEIFGYQHARKLRNMITSRATILRK